MKIDRRCISHDMISLMKDYDILRGINRKDISIDELLLLLSLSTHIRNKVSKFSHTSTGKTMSDWDCFNRLQDKIWHFRGDSMDTFGEEIDNYDTINEKLGYQLDMLPVTPVSKQLSLEATSENSSVTSDSLTHAS